MTLQQLRYVIQVVESGSFNSAAKALFISQPSLSKAIHDLEEEMSIWFICSHKQRYFTF